VSDQAWSPEPWRVGQAPGPRWVEVYSTSPTVETDACQADGPANAARIVACVNACAGIENPEAIGEVVAAVRVLLDPKSTAQQRGDASGSLRLAVHRMDEVKP